MTLPEAYVALLEDILKINLRIPNHKELKPFAQVVQKISEGLTRKPLRDDFIESAYMNDDAFRQAYLLYFTSCNLPKIFYPLSEMERSDYFVQRKELKALDLGSGAGAMIFGLSYWISDRYKNLALHFTACDQSEKALNDLRNHFGRMNFSYTLDLREGPIESYKPSSQKFDLITGGNFLNELQSSDHERILGILSNHLADDGFMILIEPALMDTSRALLMLRDSALEKGMHVYAPCFTQKNCPALMHPGDWCHHTMDWERPKFIEVIDEMIGNIRKSLKFTYVVLTKRNDHLGDYVFEKRNFESQFRTVSDSFKEKGRRRIFLCNNLGRTSFIKNKRDGSETNSVFDRLERYDIVQIEKFEVRKNDVKIGKESMVKRGI